MASSCMPADGITAVRLIRACRYGSDDLKMNTSLRYARFADKDLGASVVFRRGIVEANKEPCTL